jgi:hypothetical protein
MERFMRTLGVCLVTLLLSLAFTVTAEARKRYDRYEARSMGDDGGRYGKRRYHRRDRYSMADCCYERRYKKRRHRGHRDVAYGHAPVRAYYRAPVYYAPVMPSRYPQYPPPPRTPEYQADWLPTGTGFWWSMMVRENRAGNAN